MSEFDSDEEKNVYFENEKEHSMQDTDQSDSNSEDKYRRDDVVDEHNFEAFCSSLGDRPLMVASQVEAELFNE